ncbi:MAG: hypothetical protein P4L40_17440 [Terracidiphilus sp.]|nr:hypothetical protein [Terracidiphilus sp.]
MDIAKLRGQIAEKHGFIVTEKDPVLVSVTIQELLREEAIRDMETAARTVGAELAMGGNAPIAAGKEAAAQLINEAGGWVAERFKEASMRTVSDIKGVVTEALTSAEAASRAADAARRVAVWSACGAVGLCTLILAAAFGFWLGGR